MKSFDFLFIKTEVIINQIFRTFVTIFIRHTVEPYMEYFIKIDQD